MCGHHIKCVLRDPYNDIAAHIRIRLFQKIVDKSLGDVRRQSFTGGRLKQRHRIQFVVIIVKNGIARDARMFPQPAADFVPPRSVRPVGNTADEGEFQLMTLRADGQFNTTIYTEDDRFRGVGGGRDVLFMNEADMGRLKLGEGDLVVLTTATDDGVDRKLGGLQVMKYAIPEKCVAGYYPECNVLVPLWHHAKESKVPAAKSIPVRIELQHQSP